MPNEIRRMAVELELLKVADPPGVDSPQVVLALFLTALREYFRIFPGVSVENKGDRIVVDLSSVSPRARPPLRRAMERIADAFLYSVRTERTATTHTLVLR